MADLRERFAGFGGEVAVHAAYVEKRVLPGGDSRRIRDHFRYIACIAAKLHEAASLWTEGRLEEANEVLDSIEL